MVLKSLLKFKKITAIFLLTAFLLPTIFKPAFAYDSTPEGQTGDFNDYYFDVYRPALEADEMNLESFVNETAKGVVFGFPFHLLYSSGLGPYFQAFVCGAKLSQGLLSFNDIDECAALIDLLTQGPETASFAQAKGNILASTFKTFKESWRSRPLSLFKFFEVYKERLGIATPVYAQGFGFDTLEFTIELWTNMRNVAYGFLAIGLVIIGFMIMFRMKISPQTVVTIQTAIPKLVIALILVTFSYAIVGFLIDLVWLFTILLGNLLGQSGIMDSILQNSVWGVFFDVNMWMGGIIVTMIILGSSIIGILSMIAPVPGLIPAIVFILLGIGIMWIAFKLFWTLLKAFVFTILYTIIAPLWIFLGIIPGVGALGSWFRALLSQLVVFPATAVLLIVANRFMLDFSNIDLDELIRIIGQGIGLSPSQAPLPLMGVLTELQVQAYIALGIIFTAPSLITRLQAMVQKPLGVESAIGMAALAMPAGAAAGMYAEKLQHGIRYGGSKKHDWWRMRGAQALQQILGRVR